MPREKKGIGDLLLMPFLLFFALLMLVLSIFLLPYFLLLRLGDALGVVKLDQCPSCGGKLEVSFDYHYSSPDGGGGKVYKGDCKDCGLVSQKDTWKSKDWRLV